jgi:hypothetical protein
MRKHYITVDELGGYFAARGIDRRKNSRQLLACLRALFDCQIPTKNLVLAAVLAGYAVIPLYRGPIFTFCRVSD